MTIAKPIPELKIIYQGNDVNKLGFKWADQIIGKRSKVGGEPDFIQSKNIPNCKCCKAPMVFYAQLDSLNDDICLADCGMVYIFICFDCFEVESFIQSG